MIASQPDYTAEVTIDGEPVQVVDTKITLPKPKKPDPLAYLRKPNRTRWRGIIRAALGKRACGWQYRVELDNWPPAHIGDIRKDQLWFARFWDLHRGGIDVCAAARQANEEEAETSWAREDAAAAMQEPTVPWEQVRGELGLDDATPATGGQSAGETRAKEGRSTCSQHGDDGPQ